MKTNPVPSLLFRLPSLVYFLVVKSISLALLPASALAFSQVQAPTGREPQAQDSPLTAEFSLEALSQLHSPAGRARQEQRAPVVVFSVAALLQLQDRAACFPHEQVACLAVR